VSAGFVVDTELADKVEASPHKKRRGVVRSKRSGNNDAVEKCVQILRGDHATETDVGNEDSELTSRYDGSPSTNSQKLSTSKTPSNASGRQRRASAWEDRLSELADYRKIHWNCNVPQNYKGNRKLGTYVTTQRSHYMLYKEGKTSNMTTFRIQELESMGFEWRLVCLAAWEDRLSELADYRKIHGHCHVHQIYKENRKLGAWVTTQRNHYRLHLEGKASQITLSRMQALESLGFEWGVCVTWEDRLSELADYRKIHGHCNVPKNYSESTKLGDWVANQRSTYRLHEEGKKSYMTLSRIQELKSFGFEWDIYSTAWQARLSELTDYCKIHGHCNVPQSYSENTKLGKWVANQRRHYRLHLEGKRSSMTLSRIQALESLSFEWQSLINQGKGIPKKPSPDDDAKRVCEKALEAPEHMQQHRLRKISALEKSAAIKSTSPLNPTGMAKSTSTSPRVKPQNNKRVETGDALFDKSDFDSPPSELSPRPSLYSDRQDVNSLSPDKSAPAGNSVESMTRDHASQAKQSWPTRQQKNISSLSHAVAGAPENDFLCPAQKPANSRRGAESQLEKFSSKPLVVEPLQQKYHVSTALLLRDGST
jgi:hypothetical protein